MRKKEVIAFTNYFGNCIDVSKIENRETRVAIILLYSSLSKYEKEISSQIFTIKESLISGKEDEINEYVKLRDKSADANISDDERNKILEKILTMEDCIRIDKDYAEALNRLNDEEIETDIKKISLDVLYDAVSSCEFPRLPKNICLSELEDIFSPILK